ncbi:hypothetical protein NPIL_153611 [Nephila pilipes]|uniref:Uncharacterized protein n=1 Tax=Nephila pilipes TaxID=299642 RepID=A0A8X6NAG3_NEPPI|nr:hypothetical protein NPIL_153611 [Nephila pilipes]
MSSNGTISSPNTASGQGGQSTVQPSAIDSHPAVHTLMLQPQQLLCSRVSCTGPRGLAQSSCDLLRPTSPSFYDLVCKSSKRDTCPPVLSSCRGRAGCTGPSSSNV